MLSIALNLELALPWLLSQRSHHTRRAYQRIILEFFEVNKSKNLEQISPGEIAIILAQVKDNGGQSKYNQYRSALASFFDFQIRSGKLSINPVLAFKVKVAPLPSLRFLPDDEIHRRVVAGEPNFRNQLMLHCAFVLGLRVSEIVELMSKSFRITQNNEVYATINGKGGKFREVFVPNWLWGLIANYIQTEKLLPDEKLFFNKSNRLKPLSTRMAHEIFIAAGKRIGLTINMNPHKYRHGHAVTALQKGAHMKSLRDEMGHSNFNIMLRYVEQANLPPPSSVFSEPGLAIDYKAYSN